MHRSKWTYYLAVSYILVAIIIAIFSSYIANKGGFIPFAPDEIDLVNGNYAPPSTSALDGRVHWMGTDLIGRDIASGIINGFRVSLGTAGIAILITLLLGIPVGLLAGFYGNTKFSMNLAEGMGTFLTLIAGWYAVTNMSFVSWPFLTLLFFLIAVMWIAIHIYVSRSWKQYNLPIDLIVMRGIEIISGLPGLLILLAISSIFQSKSLAATAIVIGLLRWPILALITRNETIRSKVSPYVMSCEALGYSSWRILTMHILPNILTPIIISLVLGMASAILIESALSFLGIGAALEIQTWGSILAESRKHISAWWLAIYPGAAIFFTVLSLHVIAREKQ